MYTFNNIIFSKKYNSINIILIILISIYLIQFYWVFFLHTVQRPLQHFPLLVHLFPRTSALYLTPEKTISRQVWNIWYSNSNIKIDRNNIFFLNKRRAIILWIDRWSWKKTIFENKTKNQKSFLWNLYKPRKSESKHNSLGCTCKIAYEAEELHIVSW